MTQALAKKLGMDAPIQTIEIEGDIYGIKEPDMGRMQSLSLFAREEAAHTLSMLYDEARITRLKETPANKEVNAVRAEAAKERGDTDFVPYASEYDRLIGQETETRLMLELVPAMVCDAETGALLCTTRKDVETWKRIAGTNPAVFSKMGEVLTAQGLRTKKMNEPGAKKKNMKKRSS